MVVPACIAAVADVVMRQLATDKPSRVCVHLRGTHERKGFTIGAAAVAKQSAGVAVHTPELNTARTCALDYFAAQSALPQIYGWETSGALEVQTVKWVRLIAQDLAFPADIANVAQYAQPSSLTTQRSPLTQCAAVLPLTWAHPLPVALCRCRYIRDIDHLMIKNFPEFRCYRDIAFYFKFFLNPQKSAFPDKTNYSQRQAQLEFFYHQEQFFVGGYNTGGGLRLLSARPRVKRGEMMPTHRFASLSDPNEYTRPTRIEGEDDLLHMWELPDFGEVIHPAPLEFPNPNPNPNPNPASLEFPRWRLEAFESAHARPSRSLSLHDASLTSRTLRRG